MFPVPYSMLKALRQEREQELERIAKRRSLPRKVRTPVLTSRLGHLGGPKEGWRIILLRPRSA